MIIELVSPTQKYYETDVIPKVDAFADSNRTYPIVSIASGGIRALAHAELLVVQVAIALFEQVKALSIKAGIVSEQNLEKHSQAAAKAWEKAASELLIIALGLLEMIPGAGSYIAKNLATAPRPQTVQPDEPPITIVVQAASTPVQEAQVQEAQVQDVAPTVAPQPEVVQESEGESTKQPQPPVEVPKEDAKKQQKLLEVQKKKAEAEEKLAKAKERKEQELAQSQKTVTAPVTKHGKRKHK